MHHPHATRPTAVRLGTTLLATAVLVAVSGLALKADAASAGPPHAWLYGVWAGGIFPAPPNMSPDECRAHVTFQVSQDSVLHSTLMHPEPIQNAIAAVRGTPDGTIFTLAPTDAKPDAIAGISDDLGFGCPQPDTLRVVKTGPDEISFPDCTGFPSPLVRCSMK
ncbi:hypothetical protein [Acidisoma cladoniae]|uniref:hypothetical protein n=1 Tax=Acidisoma cladoniae TaxID=3040935 RepID=UPI00254BC723|nr:hypothetical protein [Acidisoma sp. PAMC 29798]